MCTLFSDWETFIVAGTLVHVFTWVCVVHVTIWAKNIIIMLYIILKYVLKILLAGFFGSDCLKWMIVLLTLFRFLIEICNRSSRPHYLEQLN